MNRGSPGRWLYRPQSAPDFNEAPIHESGKCHGRSASVRAGANFNEAPIHESGKCSHGMTGCQSPSLLQ